MSGLGLPRNGSKGSVNLSSTESKKTDTAVADQLDRLAYQVSLLTKNQENLLTLIGTLAEYPNAFTWPMWKDLVRKCKNRLEGIQSGSPGQIGDE